MTLLDSTTNPLVFYSAKDLPIFYTLILPEISEFKGFFWEKTLAQRPSMRNVKFSCKKVNPDHKKLASEILARFNKTNSIELWSNEILVSTIKQVKFYYESDFFESTQDVEVLMDRLKLLVDHLERQADLGRKIAFGEESLTASNNFLLYYSDVFIGDNTAILNRNGQKIIYKAHNMFDTISCNDQDFCDRTWTIHENFLHSSTLISVASQKERVRFFNRLRLQISDLKKDLDLGMP